MKAIDVFNKIQRANESLPEVPYSVWSSFDSGEYSMLGRHGIEISGDTISIGGDAKSLPEIRASLEWLVDQLGGKVNWD